MKRILLLIFAATFFYVSHAQVTIGSAQAPNSGALLDLKETAEGSSSKGLGLPRVDLSKINQLFPMFGTSGSLTNNYDTDKIAMDKAHLGLVVYNMYTDLDEGLCPGVYMWNGSIWVRIPKPCASPLTIENSPNSYIVAPGSSIEIPCGKPYLVAQQRSDLPQVGLTDKVYVEMLWQDTQNLIDKVELVGDSNGPYSKFKVTTKSAGTSGNALVALRMGANGNASDPIVWSWHIWVTDYNPNSNINGTTYPHNNGAEDYVFMDRNLGATTALPNSANVMGLTYQWGRKDPFTGASDVGLGVDPRTLYSKDNIVLTELDEIQAGVSGTGIKHTLASVADPSAANNLAYSIKAPTTFIYGKYEDPYKPMDWYAISDANQAGDDQLWGSSGTKSAFDPCPQGWRVPAYSNSKSPWFNFEGIENWSSYLSPYVEDDSSEKGANFIEELPTITKLGFYPYSSFRRPREIESGFVVGGSTEYYVGGNFADSNFINGNLRQNLLWTANAKNDDANAKALFISIAYYSFVDGTETKIENYSKAGGASVRCVKDTTTP